MWWWDLQKEVWVETLHEHDIKFSGTGTSQICKVKKEFKVTTAGAGEVLTWEVLETGLCTIACLEARFVHWYVGVVVTFTTLTGTETILTEWLDKTTLNAFMANINSTFTKMSHGSFIHCVSYRNMDTFIPSTKRWIINETLTSNYRNRFNGRYGRRFLNRFDKRIINRFIGRNTDTIRNRFMGR